MKKKQRIIQRIRGIIFSEEMNDIFAEFAVCMKKGEEPNSDKTQNLVKRLQEHITENYYHCTNEFVNEAIEVYCRK